MPSTFTCLLLLPSFTLTLLFSLSVLTTTYTAILTNFLYYSRKTAFISVEVSKPQDGVVIPAYAVGECGPLTFQWQLLSKSKSTGSFTSMSKISLELCAWTFGCWIFTATVLPSCSTALCTWASDAAPNGVSSKLTKSSFICWGEEKEASAWVARDYPKESPVHRPETACAKVGQAQPFHHSSVPCLSLVTAWPPSEACQARKPPGHTLLVETCGRPPAAHFI